MARLYWIQIKNPESGIANGRASASPSLHPDVINRRRIQLLGDVDDLSEVHAVVMADVQQDLQQRGRLARALGRLHQPRWIECLKRALRGRNRLGPLLLQF